MPRANNSGIKRGWKDSGSFIRKPPSGWLHSDESVKIGVPFIMKYVGCVQVLISMRTIPDEERPVVVRDSIAKCCNKVGMIHSRKKKCSNKLQGVIGDSYNTFHGEDVEANISKERIKISVVSSGEVMFEHPINSISFASAGEKEYGGIVAYVARDATFERASFVFKSDSQVAQDFLNTVGQAFEIKFKEFLNPLPEETLVPERFEELRVPSAPEEMPSSNYTSLKPHSEQQRANTSWYLQTRSSGTYTNTNEDTLSTGYDALQHEDKLSNLTVLPGYAKFDVGIYAEKQNDQNMMFSFGDNYSEPDSGLTEIAAIYDNPIVEQIGHDTRENGDNLPLYDNPTDILDQPLEGSEHDDARKSWITFNENEAEKKEVKDQQGYLVPSTSVDEEESDYQAVPTREKFKNADPLKRENWFHGKISREVAENLIKQDGDFLVRERSNPDGQYVLTGMHDGLCRHLLLVDPNGKVRTKDKEFKDVPELISYHLKNTVPIISGGSSVYLKQEIKRKNLNRDSYQI